MPNALRTVQRLTLRPFSRPGAGCARVALDAVAHPLWIEAVSGPGDSKT